MAQMEIGVLRIAHETGGAPGIMRVHKSARPAGHALNEKEAAVGRCVATWWCGHMGGEGKVRQPTR